MRILSFLIVLFCFLLCSCQQKESVIDEYYEDDSPKVVRIYKKGDRKNPLKETVYYPDGIVQIVGAYKNNKRHGKWIFYYSDGKKWSEAVFKEGVHHGKATTWFENGLKRYEGTYKNGEKSGKWLFWDEMGHLSKEVKY